MKGDLYKLIHKAQRQRLFALSVKIGKTDFDDQAQGSHIKGEIRTMIAHLRKHSETEETFIHPLYHIFNTELALLESQHIKLESHIESLEKAIGEEQLTSRLYEDFNRFLVDYLQHIEEEENLQRKILWKYYSNEDLMDVMKRFQQTLSSEQMLDNMKFMLPSLGTSEIIILLKNMKQSLSEPIFHEIFVVVENAFAGEEWKKIKLEFLTSTEPC